MRLTERQSMRKARSAELKEGVGGETLRDRILKAAFVEFGDNGFAGARVDEIAKSAGASKQVIYHHFQSKDALFGAVVEKAYYDVRGAGADIHFDVDGFEPRQALRELAARLFRPSIDTVRFQRIMHDENRFGGVHSAHLHEARQAYRSLLDLLAEILERGASAGVFRKGIDPAELYISLSSMFSLRLTNPHTLSNMLGTPLNTEEGARRSREAAIAMIIDALRP
jgi:TetR/AcrR family transcriptional regulator